MQKQHTLAPPQHPAPKKQKGLKELFRSIDADGSGTITVGELRNALAAWGHKISEDELSSVMAVADVSGDGLIDYNEFVAATLHVSKLEKEETLQKVCLRLRGCGVVCCIGVFACVWTDREP
jgi:calcium-dependent protein kinase